VSINIGKILALATLAFLVLAVGCNSSQQAQPAQLAPQQPVAPPQQVMPVQPAPAAQVAAAPAAPPPTPLTPVGDTVETPAPSSSGKKIGSGGNIDKPLPGTATSGDELIGAYTCRIDSKKLQIGPIKMPPFGCKIFKAGDGSLKVASTAEGAGSLKGNVKDHTAAGFFVTGKFEFGGNSMAIKAKMKLKGVGKYEGNGRGRLNDDKAAQISYKLTMTRK
jgi:hypothetical protein